jgi:hypothetical protein
MVLVSYIIRIYRLDESDPGMVVGIVEDIESNVKQRFASFEELKRILGSPKGRLPRNEKNRVTEK